MKKYNIIIATLLLTVVGATSIKAQEDRTHILGQSYLRGWEYSLKAGFSIGGTAPPTFARRNTQDRQLCSPVWQSLLKVMLPNGWMKKKYGGLTLGLRLETKKI